LANWRLLFLVEGLGTLLMVPFAFFFTPDSPKTARFLNAEEKEIVKGRLLRQVGHTERGGSLNVKEIGMTMLDLTAWMNAVCPAFPAIAK
jgi:hypothetical protein